MAGAGLVLAAVVGADGARERIARSSFGWRQVAAVVVTVTALAVPVLAGSWWAVQGAGGPLERRDPVLLPAFVAAEGEQGDRPRTLVLRQVEEGRLSYALLRADGPRLGDADTVAGADIDTGLDETVADLASGRGGDAATDLLPYGVRFVLLGSPVDPALADAIDAVPGLVRVSAPDRSALWKVRYPSGRVRVVSGPADTDGTVLPSGAVGVRTDIPAGARPACSPLPTSTTTVGRPPWTGSGWRRRCTTGGRRRSHSRPTADCSWWATTTGTASSCCGSSSRP